MKKLNIVEYLNFQFYLTFFSLVIYISHIIIKIQIEKGDLVFLGFNILFFIISINLFVNIILYYLSIKNKRSLSDKLNELNNTEDVNESDKYNIILGINTEFNYNIISIALFLVTIISYIIAIFFVSMGSL